MKKTVKLKNNYVDLFIKRQKSVQPFPPPAPVYVTLAELSKLNPFSSINLTDRRNEYNKSKNPLILIDVFMSARDCDVYPPLWVLNEMDRLFEARYTLHDSITLDELFGFTVRGSGRISHFEKKIESIKLDMLMRDFFKLKLLGYNSDDAAEMVRTLLLKRGGIKIGDVKYCGLESSTLKRLYSSKYSKLFKSIEPLYIDSLNKNKVEFLSQFPLVKKPTKKSKV